MLGTKKTEIPAPIANAKTQVQPVADMRSGLGLFGDYRVKQAERSAKTDAAVDAGAGRCRASRRGAAGVPRTPRQTATSRRRRAAAPIRLPPDRTRNPAGSLGPGTRSALCANRTWSTMSRLVRLSARRAAEREGSRDGGQNAGDGALPAGVALLPLGCGHLSRKAAFGAPSANQRLGLGVEAAHEARNISGAPCGAA